MFQVAVGLPVVMGQREVDGLDAVLVFLALAGITEPADAVVRLDAQFLLQRMDKHAPMIELEPALRAVRRQLRAKQKQAADGNVSSG